MKAGECCWRQEKAWCWILPNFSQFCQNPHAPPQETQSFVSSSAIFRCRLFLLLFLRSDPEPQSWAGLISFPSPPAPAPARPRVGFQTCHRIFLLLQIHFFFSQGLIPACRMEPQDHAEALGFRFILRAVLLLVWNWGFFVLGKVFFLSQGTRRKHMAMWEVGKNSGLWSKLFLLTSVSPLGEGKGGKRP